MQACHSLPLPSHSGQRCTCGLVCLAWLLNKRRWNSVEPGTLVMLAVRGIVPHTGMGHNIAEKSCCIRAGHVAEPVVEGGGAHLLRLAGAGMQEKEVPCVIVSDLHTRESGAGMPCLLKVPTKCRYELHRRLLTLLCRTCPRSPEVDAEFLAVLLCALLSVSGRNDAGLCRLFR